MAYRSMLRSLEDLILRLSHKAQAQIKSPIFEFYFGNACNKSVNLTVILIRANFQKHYSTFCVSV